MIEFYAQSYIHARSASPILELSFHFLCCYNLSINRYSSSINRYSSWKFQSCQLFSKLGSQSGWSFFGTYLLCLFPILSCILSYTVQLANCYYAIAKLCNLLPLCHGSHVQPSYTASLGLTPKYRWWYVSFHYFLSWSFCFFTVSNWGPHTFFVSVHYGPPRKFQKKLPLVWTPRSTGWQD